MNFNKSVTRALVVFATFSVVTTIVDVYHSRRLDAVEKRLEALEGHR